MKKKRQGLRVLPTRARLEEEILRQHRSGSASQETPITWHDLCLQLAGARGRRRPLSPTGARIVLRQILKDFEPSPLLAPALKTAGFVDALLDLIGRCKAAGVSPESLATFGAAEDHPTLGELAALYGAYQRRLEGDGDAIPFSDPDDRLRDATLALTEGAELPAILDKETAPYVLIQDRLDLTVAEGRLILALDRRLKEEGQALLIAHPDLRDRSEIHQDWEDRWNQALPPPHDLAPYLAALEGGEGPIGGLVARLFVADPPEAAAMDPEDDRLGILEGPTLAAELRGIVGAVRARLLAGAAPESIAIAAPNWSRYTVPLQRALDASGIRWTGPTDPPLGVKQASLRTDGDCAVG